MRRRVVLGATALAGVGLAGCSPVRLLNAGVDERLVQRDLAYGTDPRQRLDLYQPPSSQARPADGWPVVVFFYGGSWNDGERADYAFVGNALASRGLLTLVADYRLYPQVRYPQFLNDCAQATVWALANAATQRGDAQRLFVMGHSAGAYNAAMLALDRRWLQAAGSSPDRLAGWLGVAGPYDFIPIKNPKVKPVFHHPDVPPESQPIRHVSAGAPRSFVAAAASDSLVDPQRNSVQLATALKGAGVPTTLKLYEHNNHFTVIGAIAPPLRFLAPLLDDVEAFVKS
jgi:acetyl esterase/lipase